jgi:hypothetical protein
LSHGWRHGFSTPISRSLVPVLDPKDFAACLYGARACPPEDCGGPEGYDGLLRIRKNPIHREYEAMMQWLRRGFDPEAFEVEETNTYLGKLKWPGTSQLQLGRIIGAWLDRRETQGWWCRRPPQGEGER